MMNTIRLTRFKQFKDTEIELRPFSVLIGGNNSGKTTVLQAIWLALSSLHQGKLLTIDRKTLQIKVSSTGYYMFDFPFVPQGDLNSLFYNKISREGSTYDETSGTILEVQDEHGNSFKLHLRELFKNLNVKLLTPAQELEHPSLQKYAPLYISGFSGLNFQEERMFPAAVEKKLAAGDVQSIVRNIVLDLKQKEPEKYHYLEKLMREEFDFRIREVHYYGEDELFVFSEYEECKKEGNLGLEFSSCGSGMLQILQIIAVILRNCPEKTKVVLIDEPDAHLQEELQVKFVDILMRMQQELGIQIILTTHSAAVIRTMPAECVIPIVSDLPVNKGMECSDELQEVLEQYLDPYQLGRIKFSGKLAFFDLDSLDVLEQMAKLLHLPVFSGASALPVIRNWNHKDGFPFAVSAVLKEVLDRKIEIHVICDRDRLTQEENVHLQELAETNDVVLHLVSASRIESCIPQTGIGQEQAEQEARWHSAKKERRERIRMIQETDICEEAKALLEALEASEKALELPVRKTKKTIERKSEFEQMTLLDL